MSESDEGIRSRNSKKVLLVHRRNYDDDKFEDLYKDFHPFEDNKSFDSNQSQDKPELKQEFSPVKMEETKKGRA